MKKEDIIFDPYEYKCWCLLYNADPKKFESFKAFKAYKEEEEERRERYEKAIKGSED